jgi:hypothetical protein
LNKKEFEIYNSINRDAVGEKVALSGFFKELRSAKDQLIGKYAAKNERERLHCCMGIGGMKSLVVKEVLYWNKTILRRMRKTPRQGCPYRIDISHRLGWEIFVCVRDLLTCVNCYGVDVSTKKNTTTITIDYERKLDLFFKDILAEAFDGFPKKTIQDSTVKLLISKEKLFIIKYTQSTEKLDIRCFYGLWNEHQVPQHL